MPINKFYTLSTNVKADKIAKTVDKRARKQKISRYLYIQFAIKYALANKKDFHSYIQNHIRSIKLAQLL